MPGKPSLGWSRRGWSGRSLTTAAAQHSIRRKPARASGRRISLHLAATGTPHPTKPTRAPPHPPRRARPTSGIAPAPTRAPNRTPSIEQPPLTSPTRQNLLRLSGSHIHIASSPCHKAEPSRSVEHLRGDHRRPRGT